MTLFEQSRWLRIVQTGPFLRKWFSLGLDEDDLLALELEILKGPELYRKRGNPMSGATKGKKAKATLRKEPAAGGERSKKPRTHRSSTVGAEILEALEEVRDALKSGEPLDQSFTVRSYRFELTARDYRPDDVRSVRRILGLSQPLFAEFLGVDASTVRSWEQGKRPPSSMARRFMDEISADPGYWRGRLRDALSEA